MLKELDGTVIKLQGGLLGFPELNAFQFRKVNEDGIFGFLQSLEEEAVSFVVTSPFSFKHDYNFALDQTDLDDLSLESHEDALVLGIITIEKPFNQSTVNLLAPIIVNVKNWRGKQVVLSSQYNYTTKTPLYKAHHKEGVEAHVNPDA